MSLLHMSAAGGVLIVLLLVIRTAAIDRLPKKTFLALWGMVLLRLLLPFSFTFTLPIPVQAPQAFSRQAAPLPIQNDALPHFTQGNPVPAPAPAAEGIAVSPWLLVWAAGLLLCTLYFAAAYVKYRRELTGSLPVENETAAAWLAAHPLRRRIDLRQSSRIQAPLTYGIFHPVILLPKGADWSEPERLRYVLQHEYVHIRRFDAAVKLLLTAALCIHWFNPLVWAMFFLANRDLELSCDEAVVRAFGEREKSSYALALISMEERKSGLAPFSSGFSKNTIEERICAIMKFRKTSVLAVLTAVLLVAGFAAAVGVSAATAEVPAAGETQSAGKAEPAAASNAPKGTPGNESPQYLTFESVDLRYYDNGSPYLHDVITNTTDRTVVSMQYYMLAYDREGAPLKIHWNPLNSSDSKTYGYGVETERELAPGQTYDVHGGWSLMEGGDGTHDSKQVAYALYCPSLVIFQDGSVWRNPSFQDWLSAYEGKSVEVAALKSYYPFRQTVSSADIRESTASSQNAQLSKGSMEDYRSLLALKTPGYQNETVKQFTEAVLSWANASEKEDAGRYERIDQDLARGYYPDGLTNEERSFLDLTIRASNVENAVQTRAEYSGKPAVTPDLSLNLFKGEKTSSGATLSERIGSSWAMLNYGVSYKIDPAKVTVGERDAALAGAINGVQQFWDATPAEELLDLEDYEVRERIEEFLSKNSTAAVKLGFVENYFLFWAEEPDGD